MAVDQRRFGGTMETSPEVEEMMAKITEITGCAIILLPVDMTEKFRSTCEANGLHPATVFANVCEGVMRGIDENVPLALIAIPCVPDPSPDEANH